MAILGRNPLHCSSFLSPASQCYSGNIVPALTFSQRHPPNIPIGRTSPAGGVGTLDLRELANIHALTRLSPRSVLRVEADE